MKEELHLFILWERARYMEAEIIKDLRTLFSIIGCYDICWSPELIDSNFSRFYGEKLPPNSHKEKNCGAGEFRLIIVSDKNPIYQKRTTSRGVEIVNINTFDAKQKYRTWVNGNKIHGTNNPIETDHDITLLLGISSEDYLKHHTIWDGNVQKLQQNITGALGWNSIRQLFYVLNHTVRYVILRGCREAENGQYLEHTDTDILTDQYLNLWYIINGSPCRSRIRPKERIVINGINFDLDIWDTDRNYFDIHWSQSMINNRIETNGFYILNETNNFYCLLYHCLLNKNRIAPDYQPIIDTYVKKHQLENHSYQQLLVDFLQKHNYEIIQQDDCSNGFHTEDPVINRYYNKYGFVINKSSCQQKDTMTGKLLEWKSCVYDDGNSIVKAGTDWLIRNEYSFLQRLSNYNIVPRCFNIEVCDGETLLTIEKIDGVSLNDFLRTKGNRKKRIIKNVTRQIITLLKFLKTEGILHRDFTGNNLLVDSNGNVHVIDFGWAINVNSKCFPCPEMLTRKYRPAEMYSDFYTIGAVLEELADHHFPYLENVGKKLQEIKWAEYLNEDSFNYKIKIVESAVNAPFTFSDYFHNFLFRHKRISRQYYKIKHRLTQ